MIGQFANGTGSKTDDGWKVVLSDGVEVGGHKLQLFSVVCQERPLSILGLVGTFSLFK
jgi:hypothetical protein